MTVTVQEVANRQHRDMYGPDSEHSGFHSCPCWHYAVWLLGLQDKPEMYWPDGEGGNAYERGQKERQDAYAQGKKESRANLARKVLAIVEFQSGHIGTLHDTLAALRELFAKEGIDVNDE